MVSYVAFIALMGAIALVATLTLVIVHARAVLRSLADELNAALPPDRRQQRSGPVLSMLAHTVTQAKTVLGEFAHRVPGRHPVTGLQTREALMAAINCAGDGLLGVFELSDFDALAAQDADMADAVLKLFSERTVRMTGTNRTVAQIDRARFAVWFVDPEPAESSTAFAALCYALRDRIEIGALDLLPKVAIGQAVQSNAVDTGATLLARAIGSLTDTTTVGLLANSPEAAATARHRVTMEHDLRQAVSRRQFVLQYQPFVDADQGAVCGAEALLRWHHPDHGLISPGVFVPLVEKTGLSEEVGLWVLDTAISEATTWRAKGCPDIKVAANISAHQLARPDLDTVIARMLTRHDLPPSLLELELTETAAAHDSAAIGNFFERLRQCGTSISIDDFGAGYSGLSYLRRLKFDKLKIDREFVTAVDHDRQNQAICQSIIALGRGLGIAVLAEGVERHEEYLWLRRHGCRYFQGYLFSRPLDPAAFVAFARDRQSLAAKIDCGPANLQQKIGVLAA